MLRFFKSILLFLIFLLINLQSIAQIESPRIKQSLNEGWQFRLEEAESENWQQVDIPHTWNKEDAFDEKPGYLRTIGWYKKRIDLKPKPGKEYVILFEAVNQVAEVYVNGEKAGEHKGGYTAFTVNITPYLKDSPNEIQVKVDNRHNANIPPLKGDFNFYGGIYRDVWLYELNDIHFDFDEYASEGIAITTPRVSESSASVQINGTIRLAKTTLGSISVINRLLDSQNKIIAEKELNLVTQDSIVSFTETFESIESPRLWHPDHPHLYTMVSEIESNEGVADRITTPVGFRWFRFDSDSGFYLNGSRLKLMGVNRHQDYQGMGNALSNERHVSDMKLVKESGSNFLRTAHYPQDPAVLEACDRLGLLVSMEIPLDHEITDSEGFYKNSIRMQREMIRQNYNHPSIIVWAYMNEMLLGRSWEQDSVNIQKITEFARELEEVTRKEDSTRVTMIPNHGDFEMYHKSGLTEIPMLVGWNLYYGWYESELDGLGDFLDNHHRILPHKPTLITEYGAGSDPRIRSLQPLRFDFSIEWQTRFLQNNLMQVMNRPFVAGSAVWNLFDFGSESRRDAVPTINSKGLMTFDRQPKDSYYLLQSWLKEDPMVRIGSKSWDRRNVKSSTDNNSISIHPISVYGNTEEAELFINGASLGAQKFANRIAEWDVPFRSGRNVLEVQSKVDGRVIKDVAAIDVDIHRAFPNKEPHIFGDIYINAGSNFHFVDEENGIVWRPDETYQKGFWGYIGGENYSPRNRGIGTDTDMLGTDRDPLFQTQRTGVKEYRFDVPPGTYEVLFLFADITGKRSVFDVTINDTPVFEKMNLNGQYGRHQAVKKKAEVYSNDNQLIIGFRPLEGEAVINGMGIRKIK